MKIFCDSSAFAKRYILENGSDDMDAVTDQALELGLCVIALPEIISAFSRLTREKKIDKAQFDKIKQAFFEDIRDIIICQLSPETLQVAYQLLQENMLRAMDALHVAAAYIWKCGLFVSSDSRQLNAAQLLGLNIKKI